MKKLKVVSIVFAVLALSGCSPFAYIKEAVLKTEPPRPDAMKNVDKVIMQKYTSVNGILGKYEQCIQKPDYTCAKLERNTVISDMMKFVDQEHHNYKSVFRNAKAGKDLFSDLAIIGLNAAAAVSGTSAVKSILSVASGSVAGANASFDKDMFGEFASLALLAQMDASRSKIAGEIYKSMQNDVIVYPLSAGLNDIERYYFAGSLTQAITDLYQTANAKKTEEDDKTQGIRGKSFDNLSSATRKQQQKK